MRCHEFRYASSLCISGLFQHEHRSPNLHLPLLGPLQLLWFMWCKSIWHITTAKNMNHWLSAIVTGITLYHLKVICFYIPSCNVQTTGFASLMLLSNSMSLSPSTYNWCSIHSRQTSILYFAHIFVYNFIAGGEASINKYWNVVLNIFSTNSRTIQYTNIWHTCTITFTAWPLNSNVAADSWSYFHFKCPSHTRAQCFPLSSNNNYI